MSFRLHRVSRLHRFHGGKCRYRPCPGLEIPGIESFGADHHYTSNIHVVIYNPNNFLVARSV